MFNAIIAIRSKFATKESFAKSTLKHTLKTKVESILYAFPLFYQKVAKSWTYQ